MCNCNDISYEGKPKYECKKYIIYISVSCSVMDFWNKVGKSNICKYSGYSCEKIWQKFFYGTNSEITYNNPYKSGSGCKYIYSEDFHSRPSSIQKNCKISYFLWYLVRSYSESCSKAKCRVRHKSGSYSYRF